MTLRALYTSLLYQSRALKALDLQGRIQYFILSLMILKHASIRLNFSLPYYNSFCDLIYQSFVNNLRLLFPTNLVVRT